MFLARSEEYSGDIASDSLYKRPNIQSHISDTIINKLRKCWAKTNTMCDRFEFNVHGGTLWHIWRRHTRTTTSVRDQFCSGRPHVTTTHQHTWYKPCIFQTAGSRRQLSHPLQSLLPGVYLRGQTDDVHISTASGRFAHHCIWQNRRAYKTVPPDIYDCTFRCV